MCFNEQSKLRPVIMNINSDEPSFYAYSILVNKYSDNCIILVIHMLNTAWKVSKYRVFYSAPYFPVFGHNRNVSRHETSEFRLDPSICNDNQHWNNDKCKCECKELIDKARCDKGFFWNPSNCKCECDKSFDVGEYLNYANCKCRKWLIDELVEECNEDVNEKEIIYKTIIMENVCNSCTIYIILFVIALFIIIDISSAFIFFHW